MKKNCYRAVVSAHIFSASGLFRAKGRSSRWWALTLECGHVEERPVKYTPAGKKRGGSWRNRKVEDALPAPKRVVCHLCEWERQKARNESRTRMDRRHPRNPPESMEEARILEAESNTDQPVNNTTLTSEVPE